MTIRRRCIAVALVAAVSAFGGATTVASAAPPEPGVWVSPASDLEAGDPVWVTARGLPATTAVTIFLCDWPADDWSWCDTSLGEATTTAAGTLSLRVRVTDPVYRTPVSLLQALPIYCRADNCRVFVTWVDNWIPVSVGSDSLEFTGSPGTVTASPDIDLQDAQRVRVTGTAYGSDARSVQIWQHECVSYYGVEDCSSKILLTTVPLRRDDTFAATVRVHKFGGSEGAVCGAADTRWCTLSAHIIDPKTGLPDPTFGDPRFADPGTSISFAPEPSGAAVG